ncbi:MAG: hypothetical protein JWN02_1620 [Acidobacteria bacterium]|nr:hypothetical protein [Acidobacteriota bacterium]
MLGRYATVENYVVAVASFRVGWNNQTPGSQNQYTGEVLNIYDRSSATIDLIDLFDQGRIVNGATCWVEVSVNAAGYGGSNGNFTFSSTAARALYKVEGPIGTWGINGPYQ